MPSSRLNIAGIILAAGASKRMGAVKLLLPFGRSPLLERVLDNARRSMLEPIIVVLGHEAETIRQRINFKRAQIRLNPEYHTGLSSSLRVGIQSLPKETDGAMFLLGDQPLVSSKTINCLFEVFHQHASRLIIPTYQGKRGNPVVVPRSIFNAVQQITGDTGARVLFHRLKEQIREVEVSDPGIHLDVDTLEDYRALLSLLST